MKKPFHVQAEPGPNLAPGSAVTFRKSRVLACERAASEVCVMDNAYGAIMMDGYHIRGTS